MQRRGTNSPREKKVRLQKARAKTMLNFFSDAAGSIHREFVPVGTNSKQAL